MNVEERFYRGEPVAREARHLGASTYNLAHRLFQRSPNGSLFVPIRPMQFLAVIDQEEFIFVDREGGRMIDIAWQRFRPNERAGLDDPVPYEAIYYSPTGASQMNRLQGEFLKALQLLDSRRESPPLARVIKIDRRPT